MINAVDVGEDPVDDLWRKTKQRHHRDCHAHLCFPSLSSSQSLSLLLKSYPRGAHPRHQSSCQERGQGFLSVNTTRSTLKVCACGLHGVCLSISTILFTINVSTIMMYLSLSSFCAGKKNINTDSKSRLSLLGPDLPPPDKRRRGLAGSIVSTALSAAFFSTAVGLTVYRL